MSGRSVKTPPRRPAGRPRASAPVTRTFSTTRRRRNRAWLLGTTGVLALAGLIVVLQLVGGSDRSSSSSAGTDVSASSANRVAAGGAAVALPWAAPNDASTAIEAAGLTPAPGEGTVEHYHAHLDVLVNGQPVAVSSGIGVDEAKQLISPLHTHDASGVVHVESPTKGSPFYLGQLFREWNVKLTATQLGGLHADAGHELTAYVDGKAVTGNPAAIRFAGHQEITLVYGPAGATPTVPASYDFPAGE